jgi:hypothetical protein
MGICYKKYTEEKECVIHANNLKNINNNFNQNIKEFLNLSDDNNNEKNNNLYNDSNNKFSEEDNNKIMNSNNNNNKKNDTNNSFNNSLEINYNYGYNQSTYSNSNKEITICFIFNDSKELYISVKLSNNFIDIDSQLKEKYNWINTYNEISYYYNEDKIDESKTIKELGIKNNDIIKIVAE